MTTYCDCGHEWADHYDCAYCLIDGCCCGPCELCGTQFAQPPINLGTCSGCKDLKTALDKLLEG